MRIVFMGSPDFAVPTLEALRASHHEVVAAVTQPDRPFGRRLHMHSPPVKDAAHSLGIPVLQPATTRSPEFVSEIESLRPDVLIVVAYGEILRPALLRIPPRGAVNLHASLLPKYRGAAPVAWAILRGETVTGCSTMQINERMDAGDVYLQEVCAIQSTETTESLTRRLSLLGAPLMKETIDKLEREAIQAQPQDPGAVTYAPKLKKEDGLVDWSRSSGWISRQTRAFAPWPGTFSFLNNLLIKLWVAQASEEKTAEPPGTIFHVDKKAILVACGEGTVLQIEELQPQNRPRLTASDFINGAHLMAGRRFSQPNGVS